MSKQIIHTDEAPAAVGPYSQAIAVTGTKTVYLSGQIGLEPGTGDLVSENFEAQVRQAFANMQAVIKEAGGTLDNIVKLTLFLTDLNKFTAANAIMAEIIPQPFPARPSLGVARLREGAQFEVEAILVLWAARTRSSQAPSCRPPPQPANPLALLPPEHRSRTCSASCTAWAW